MKSKTAAVLLIVFTIAFYDVARAQKSTRPNFVIIVTDDQNLDELSATYMPKTFQRIVQQGALFTNAFVTTPLCCPSRSSIFTGLYAHHHFVGRNSSQL